MFIWDYSARRKHFRVIKLGIKKLKAVVKENYDSGKLRDNLYTRYADIIKEFETDVAGFKRTY